MVSTPSHWAPPLQPGLPGPDFSPRPCSLLVEATSASAGPPRTQHCMEVGIRGPVCGPAFSSQTSQALMRCGSMLQAQISLRFPPGPSSRRPRPIACLVGESPNQVQGRAGLAQIPSGPLARPRPGGPVHLQIVPSPCTPSPSRARLASRHLAPRASHGGHDSDRATAWVNDPSHTRRSRTSAASHGAPSAPVQRPGILGSDFVRAAGNQSSAFAQSGGVGRPGSCVALAP